MPTSRTKRVAIAALFVLAAISLSACADSRPPDNTFGREADGGPETSVDTVAAEAPPNHARPMVVSGTARSAAHTLRFGISAAPIASGSSPEHSISSGPPGLAPQGGSR